MHLWSCNPLPAPIKSKTSKLNCENQQRSEAYAVIKWHDLGEHLQVSRAQLPALRSKREIGLDDVGNRKIPTAAHQQGQSFKRMGILLRFKLQRQSIIHFCLDWRRSSFERLGEPITCERGIEQLWYIADSLSISCSDRCREEIEWSLHFHKRLRKRLRKQGIPKRGPAKLTRQASNRSGVSCSFVQCAIHFLGWCLCPSALLLHNIEPCPQDLDIYYPDQPDTCQESPVMPKTLSLALAEYHFLAWV